MRSTFKILFYINRQKTRADGKTAILCRIIIDGKSAAITTGEECNPSEWNSKQGLTTDRMYVVKQKCTTANIVIYSEISLFYYQKFFC